MLLCAEPWPSFGSNRLKKRGLPGSVSGKLVLCLRMLERVKARKSPNGASFFCQAYAAPPAFTPRWTASMIKLRGHKFELCRKKGAPVDKLRQFCTDFCHEIVV